MSSEANIEVASDTFAYMHPRAALIVVLAVVFVLRPLVVVVAVTVVRPAMIRVGHMAGVMFLAVMVSMMVSVITTVAMIVAASFMAYIFCVAVVVMAVTVVIMVSGASQRLTRAKAKSQQTASKYPCFHDVLRWVLPSDSCILAQPN